MVRAALVYVAGLLFWASPFLPQAEGQYLSHRRGAFQPAGGASYLLEEDFETTGNPGWTVVFGTPDWDYATSPAPLEGSESLQVADAGNEQVRSTTFTAQANLYAYFRMAVFAPSGNTEIVFFEDSGNTARCKIEYRSGGGIWVEHGSVSGSVSSALSTSTLNHIWLEYEKGTGADGVARVYHSLTSTKPGSPSSSVVTGTATADVVQLRFSNPTNGLIIDDVKVSSSVIGSAP